MKYSIALLLGVLLLMGTACQPNTPEGEHPEGNSDSPATPATERSNPAKPSSAKDLTQLSDQIDLENVDYGLLNSLIFEEINKVRTMRNVEPLLEDRTLFMAASAHNEYLIEIDDLTHEQADPAKRTVKDRVQSFGGDFGTLGENVLFEGMRIQTTNGKTEVIASPYINTAESMVKNWIESPGHYKNLINPTFKFVGTATGYSTERKAIFATQVFGG